MYFINILKELSSNNYIMSHGHDSTSATGDSVTGRVKWFNSKAGYGFITYNNESDTESDVFVHHISLPLALFNYTSPYGLSSSYQVTSLGCRFTLVTSALTFQ